MIKIGLIIGSGTGREVADIFKVTVNKFVEKSREPEIQFIEYPGILHSYWSIRERESREIYKLARQEAQDVWEWIKDFYKQGGRAIFRTAFNAEALYILRKMGHAVKRFEIKLADNRKILIIRDEMQGFYCVNDYNLLGNKIVYEEEFSYEFWEKILDFAVALSQSEIGNNFLFWLIYKFHLFSNILEKWLHTWVMQKKIKPLPEIFQPDSGLTRLLGYLIHPDIYKSNLLLVVGNEIGDIIYEWLMFYLKIGSRNTLYTENIYLHPLVKGLRVFQTVHGSADDISNTGKLNPIATLRCSAALLSFVSNDYKYINMLERILNKFYMERNIDDWLSEVRTEAILNYVFDRLDEEKDD